MSLFENDWNWLKQDLERNPIVYTIKQRKPNVVEQIDETGLQVRATKDSEIVQKEWIESAWSALRKIGQLAADDIPGTGKFRSSFIMGLLARLPDVRTKNNPTQLYVVDLPKPIVGQTYSHPYLQSYFAVGNMGGIRYKGSAQQPDICVIITSLTHIGSDNPYQDRMIGDQLFYTGEGQTGAQQLTKGNLALYNQATQRYPLFVFERLGNDMYKYLGRMQVTEVREEIQKDNEGTERTVFIYTMHSLAEEVEEDKTEGIEQHSHDKDTETPELNRLQQLQSELETLSITQKRYKRNQEMVDTLKRMYDYRCQLCSDEQPIPPIIMKNGKNYVEVHHILGFSEAIRFVSDEQEEAKFQIDHYKNAIVLCVYHHKLLHHYKSKILFDKNEKVFKSVDASLKIELTLNQHL